MYSKIVNSMKLILHLITSCLLTPTNTRFFLFREKTIVKVLNRMAKWVVFKKIYSNLLQLKLDAGVHMHLIFQEFY